mgnify:CR=1 FL=1
MPNVSIIIVCMNNLKNLYPCLTSIRKYTTVSYETLVVAYLFSKENLEKVKHDFPWVTFIESNEIRGFSENNNLALRQAKGKYCFVVNDDTEMKMPVIDRLVESFGRCPEDVAIVSPSILNSNGEVSVCGKPPITIKEFILKTFHLWNENQNKEYVNKQGLFKTYNILGAAFLIRTDIFKKEGWFDEYYFFCPEDIALSTSLNKKGFSCYVNADVSIIHYEGMSNKSISYIQTATMPASKRGELRFFSNGNSFKYCALVLINYVGISLNFIIHRMKGLCSKRPNSYYVLSIGDLNILKTLSTTKTPKEIFLKYYLKIRNKHEKYSYCD